MMIQAGRINLLKVLKEVDFGIYLDAGEMGEVLMPAKWVPEGTKPGDVIQAFIYFDSEDRPIATTIIPKAQVGDFAYLEVKQLNQYGAFLDWGLDKDLIVPFNEQNAKMAEGRKYLVYVFVDSMTKRIAASARLEKFLDKEPPDFKKGQEVDLIIWTRTDIGYKAVVDRKHTGILYDNQLFRELNTGMHIKGFINKIRDDDKIDLILERPGYEKIDQLSHHILEVLDQHSGFLGLNDKSSSNEIARVFNTSKKNFKKAIGALYKKQLIDIKENGIVRKHTRLH